jgi:hypothetical protein
MNFRKDWDVVGVGKEIHEFGADRLVREHNTLVKDLRVENRLLVKDVEIAGLREGAKNRLCEQWCRQRTKEVCERIRAFIEGQCSDDGDVQRLYDFVLDQIRRVDDGA